MSPRRPCCPFEASLPHPAQCRRRCRDRKVVPGVKLPSLVGAVDGHRHGLVVGCQAGEHLDAGRRGQRGALRRRRARRRTRCMAAPAAVGGVASGLVRSRKPASGPLSRAGRARAQGSCPRRGAGRFSRDAKPLTMANSTSCFFRSTVFLRSSSSASCASSAASSAWFALSIFSRASTSSVRALTHCRTAPSAVTSFFRSPLSRAA